MLICHCIATTRGADDKSTELPVKGLFAAIIAADCSQHQQLEMCCITSLSGHLIKRN